jgi:uncharacterized protein
MKRILSLDGGGIRGVFTLEVLLEIENLLREQYGTADFVLADHFDFFAGTSTGAIIAACLCWGLPVETILDLYVKYGTEMFRPVPWYNPYKKFFVARFNAKPLSNLLQRTFSEDGAGKVPALLGSDRLRKLLLVVVRNHSTGSAWPLTNNPHAIFADPSLPDSNLNIPLWQVVRASTAAPVYFDPEVIDLGDKRFTFVDGSVTPYNNPTLIAALTAILPCYRLEWPAGPDNIRITSVGTIRFSSGLPPELDRPWLGQHITHVPLALIQGITWQQDYLCRVLGKCLFGEALDAEIGNLVDAEMPGQCLFSYVRYNKSYKREEVAEFLRSRQHLTQIDAVSAIPILRGIGQTYAKQNVKLEHLM